LSPEGEGTNGPKIQKKEAGANPEKPKEKKHPGVKKLEHLPEIENKFNRKVMKQKVSDNTDGQPSANKKKKPRDERRRLQNILLGRKDTRQDL